jgi:hypothetical protein
MTSSQFPMLSVAWSPVLDTPPISECHKIWVIQTSLLTSIVTTNSGQDSRTARFTPCFVPFVATLPTVTAALLLLTYSLRLLNPYRPRWTKPFLKETKAASDEFDDAPCYQLSASTWTLFTITLIGIVSQITAMLFPARLTAAVYPAIAWVRQSF